jgi:hypothetical protein
MIEPGQSNLRLCRAIEVPLSRGGNSPRMHSSYRNRRNHRNGMHGNRDSHRNRGNHHNGSPKPSAAHRQCPVPCRTDGKWRD